MGTFISLMVSSFHIVCTYQNFTLYTLYIHILKFFNYVSIKPGKKSSEIFEFCELPTNTDELEPAGPLVVSEAHQPG